MRVGFGVLVVAVWCLGVDHVPHEVVAHFPPPLRWAWVVLMLPDEPCVPTARERNRIQSGERLACAIFLRPQGGDARFNLGFPFTELRLCFVSCCVRRQLEMGFTSDAIEARVPIANIFRDALARKPSTIRRTT
jgi:hypothetical protein